MTALTGMTGFARVSGEAEFGAWAWEIKSVNGKGLDVRVNTPPGFDGIERGVKASASKRFKRGSLQASLRFEQNAADGGVTVNESALSVLVAAFTKTHGDPPTAEALAALMTAKGVVETGSASLRDLAGDTKIIAAITTGAETALDQLLAARQEEGAALFAIMSNLLDEMAALTKTTETLAETQPRLLKEKLEKQLAELDADKTVDADRLAVEVALSAAKADVREETDRLNAHFEAGRALLGAGEPVGRKLDFLAQELNREANTLCSKSISLDLTNAGLGLKALIDQFKEQAANVE